MIAECEIIIQIINFIILNESALFVRFFPAAFVVAGQFRDHSRTSACAIVLVLALICICNGFCFAMPTGKLNFANGRSEMAQQK